MGVHQIRLGVAYLVVEIVPDCCISAGEDFMCLREEPLFEVYVTAAVFTRILGDMQLVGKLLRLQLAI